MSNKRGGNIENIKVCTYVQKLNSNWDHKCFDWIKNGFENFLVADRLVHTQLKTL